MIHTFIFKRLPMFMVRSMVIGSITRLNDIYVVNGVSDSLSPRTTVIGCPGPDYNVIINIAFCTYAQVNGEPNPATDIIQKNTGAIALRSVVNDNIRYVKSSRLRQQRD